MRMPTMKSFLAALAMSLALCQASLAQEARLTLPDFRNLEDKATEVVTVTLDAALLGLASRFLNEQSSEEAAIKEMVRGLSGVYVKSFTFDTDFAYPQSDVDNVRKQLQSSTWQRLVEVRSKKERTQVDVYISLKGDKANGLAVIAS